ncbi:MAG: hypothetical protein JOZ00_01135 [Mycobacterium sp.]|uniref:DUF7159 family protein n=1 Tax=Mycobacterium sp. TaxID=1785 RepID=UPI001ED363C1|nr:hypothetical protein [Mycobacterium sp.]MBV8785277.1 hypothetical protein [Mycobacterium sp.]
MDFVLGVSMAPETVRLVVIEGQDADGVTVEQDEFEVTGGGALAPTGAIDQVMAAIGGTREGAREGGHRLASTGVTCTNPVLAGALRDAMTDRDVEGVMLVAPLLAAAALAQTVGGALGYEHIAMLFVEPESATLAVVDVGDGSIVDLHRHRITAPAAPQEVRAAELATMVAGLDARGSWADGVFLIGCGTDIVALKPALEAATPLQVTAPEEPDMALARGAALASANAPLFSSSTVALAYALDPGTGEMSPRAFSLASDDVWDDPDARTGALAYSAVEDHRAYVRVRRPRKRWPMVLAGSAVAAIAVAVAGVVLVSVPSGNRLSAVQNNPRVAAPATPPPAAPPSAPPEAQVPAPSPPAPAPTPTAPPQTEAAAPAPAPAPAPTPTQRPTPHTEVIPAPAAPVYRAPTQPAPQYVPPTQPQAPAPSAPAYSPPQYTPPPQAPPPAPVQQPSQPPVTMYLHLPFVTVPIPINPPHPPPSQ